MTATLGTAQIARAALRGPRYGAGTADVMLLGDTALAVGSRQTLTLGNRSMVGTLRPGGDFGGQAGYSWIAGGNGWSKVVDRRHSPPHDDNGLRLSRILADLAADAGEIGIVLDGIPDRVVGQDWTRPQGLARDLLDALTGGQWWIADDGVTHVGPRPATSFSSPTLTVEPYDPALRWGTVRLADDNVAPLVPGCTLTAQGLPAPILVGSVLVRLEGSSLEVELWGERSGAELFRAMVDACTAWRTYLAANPYTVASVGSDGRVAVVPSDARSVAMPDAPQLPHLAGIPGASYELAPGAGVAVAYLAGDPGSPVVHGHLPGVLPVSTLLDASSSLTLGTGGAPLPLLVAVDASWFTAVTAAINALKAGGLETTATQIAAVLGALPTPPTPPTVAGKAKAST